MPRGSGEECHQIARRRVDLVEILEEQDDRTIGGEPAEKPAQRLEGPLRASLGGARLPEVDRRDARDAVEERTEKLGGRPQEARDARRGERPKVALEGEPHGPIRRAAPGGQAVAAEPRERKPRRRDDPRLQLVEQPARTHPARTGHEDRAAASRREIGDRRPELLELALTSDESARFAPSLHSGILRSGAGGRARASGRDRWPFGPSRQRRAFVQVDRAARQLRTRAVRYARSTSSVIEVDPATVGATSATMSPRVIRWSHPSRPSGVSTRR